MASRVVDASLLAAIVFGEPRADEAAALLADHVIYAPTLLRYEMAHVAVKKVGQYPDCRDSILQALALAFRLSIRWAEVKPEDAAALALETGLTAYDASYLHVSRELDVPLLTFDRTLLTFCND